MSVRSQPSSRTGYSPYELVTGRPMSGPHSPPIGPMTDHLDEILLEYVQALTLASRALFTQVTAPPLQVTQPAPLTLPGDYLYVKVHKRKSLEPRWTGPYKVLLATPFSVSLLGKYGAEWHHLTHTRKADDHTSRTYDQVHADLLDIGHEEPTEQLAVQQELPSKPDTVCGSPVKCVGRPADPVRVPENLHETPCPDPGTPDPGTHRPPDMVLGMGDQQRRRSQRHRP